MLLSRGRCATLCDTPPLTVACRVLLRSAAAGWISVGYPSPVYGFLNLQPILTYKYAVQRPATEVGRGIVLGYVLDLIIVGWMSMNF